MEFSKIGFDNFQTLLRLQVFQKWNFCLDKFENYSNNICFKKHGTQKLVLKLKSINIKYDTMAPVL